MPKHLLNYCRLRLAQCTEADIVLLKSQEGDTYPEDTLHVYTRNVDVNEHNIKILHKLAPQTDHIIIQAEDDTESQTRQISISNIPKNSTATGGLPTTLIVAKTAKVMLTVNVDGLVNGARGIITSVIKTDKGIIAIPVKFAKDLKQFREVHTKHYSQKQFPSFNTQSILASKELKVLKSPKTNFHLF